MGSQYESFQTKLEQEFGKRIPGGYEFVGTRRIGKSLISFVYVLKYEKSIYPIGLRFYKAREEWTLNGIALGGGDAADDFESLERNRTCQIKSTLTFQYPHRVALPSNHDPKPNDSRTLHSDR